MTPAEHAELMARLHPPRLPEGFAAMGWADLLAAFGLGLVLAALLLCLLAPMLRRRPPPVRLRDRLEAAAALPKAERALVLSRILEERGGKLPDILRAGLYTAGGADPAAIEALIRRNAGGRR